VEWGGKSYKGRLGRAGSFYVVDGKRFIVQWGWIQGVSNRPKPTSKRPETTYKRPTNDFGTTGLLMLEGETGISLRMGVVFGFQRTVSVPMIPSVEGRGKGNVCILYGKWKVTVQS
jgi:hypothetical protein